MYLIKTTRESDKESRAYYNYITQGHIGTNMSYNILSMEALAEGLLADNITYELKTINNIIESCGYRRISIQLWNQDHQPYSNLYLVVIKVNTSSVNSIKSLTIRKDSHDTYWYSYYKDGNWRSEKYCKDFKTVKSFIVKGAS
jgi:hypothetical protein